VSKEKALINGTRSAIAVARVTSILALMGALTAAGCAEKKRTEIIIGLATDLTAPTPLSTVHLEVLHLPDGMTVGEQDIAISGNVDGVYELPGTYGVYSANGTADRVQINLTAMDPGMVPLVKRTAVLNLVPGKTLFVRLGVISACEGMNDCPTGDTCVSGRCLPVEIDSSRLPVYTTDMEKKIDCMGAGDTVFVDTSTKQPLPVLGTVCPDQGTCQEGVCLAAVPGSFTPAKGALTMATAFALEIGKQLPTLNDGTVLVAGGEGLGNTPVLATAQLYDPNSQSFKATGKMSTARTYFGEAKLPDGRVLIAGGINESAAALDTAEIFDPKTGTFTPTATPMTVARTFPSTATLSDGRVLIVGGVNQIQSYSLGLVMFFGGLTSAEIYDPVSDTFTATAGNLVDGRAFPHVTPLPGGDALVTCGEAQGGFLTSVEHFVGSSATFDAVPLATLPSGATGCDQNVAELSDGRLLVTMMPASDVWLFDPSTALFTRAADHLTSPPAQLAEVLADGRVLYAGGGATNKQAYLFDPTTGTFAFTAGGMNVARPSFMSALLDKGDVLLAGTGDASAEIFHPAAPATAGGATGPASANLIVNGDAELAPGSPNGTPVATPGWTVTGEATALQYDATGGYPLSTDPGPPSRGTSLFAGGPADAVSSLSQVIDLTASAAAIDSGAVTFTLAGYLGGYTSQEDNAQVTASFENTAGTQLALATIGPVTAEDRNDITSLLLRSTSGSVPAQTRFITVTVTMTRASGTANDGYADNLSLALTGI
jgi:hypothetical protein